MNVAVRQAVGASVDGEMEVAAEVLTQAVETGVALIEPPPDGEAVWPNMPDLSGA